MTNIDSYVVATIPTWIGGEPVAKKIGDERLQTLIPKITPLVKKNGDLLKFKPVHPRNQSFLWSPEFYGAPVTSFELIRIVSVDFPCGYAALFKPSIAEVLAWLPETPDINAFYLNDDIDIYNSGDFQRCKVYFGKIDTKDRRGPSPFKKLPPKPPSLKRSDEQMVRFIADVQGVITATSNERHRLWERWHHDKTGPQIEWKDNNSGLMETVGYIDKRPIAITLNTAVVKGKKILFVDGTSQLVDWAMIDKWIEDNLPDIQTTDAGNFHNVVNY